MTRKGGFVQQVSLIGFADEEAAALAALLDSGGYEAVCQPAAGRVRGREPVPPVLSEGDRKLAVETEPAPAPKGLSAAFVCGDRPGWREALREVRAVHGPVFLVVAARLPDWKQWLDALEAGADDYCSTLMDAQQFRWLFPQATRFQPGQAMSAKTAA